MKKLILILVLALGACAGYEAPPKESILWLPLPETMQKVQWLEFTNKGPEEAVIKAQPPRMLVGDPVVRAGETVRLYWALGVATQSGQYLVEHRP